MNETVKKYGHWFGLAVVVIVIVILLLLQKFRSGYTPPVGAQITMMDLKEFSSFTNQQKDNYNTLLSNSLNDLSAAANSNSLMAYQIILSNIMTQMESPPPPSMPPPPPMR